MTPRTGCEWHWQLYLCSNILDYLVMELHGVQHNSVNIFRSHREVISLLQANHIILSTELGSLTLIPATNYREVRRGLPSSPRYARLNIAYFFVMTFLGMQPLSQCGRISWTSNSSLQPPKSCCISEIKRRIVPALRGCLVFCSAWHTNEYTVVSVSWRILSQNSTHG